jgi:hypothetical protein
VPRTLTLALVLVGGTSLAEAQATRTWVSGVSGGAAIVSFGNNRVLGNGADGAPTQTIGQQ